jgi:hypothetical protein
MLCFCSCQARQTIATPCKQACCVLRMASKDLCVVCVKPFYGKQKFLLCYECDVRSHCSCLQADVTELNGSASTGKSTYRCDSCKKLKTDAAKDHSNTMSDLPGGLSTHGSPTNSGDYNSLNVQLQAIRANGICTMEMVRSLVDIVSTLSSEVHQLRVDNETLKTQLRDLQQAPSTHRELAPCAGATNAKIKSCRVFLCPAGGNPATVSPAPTRNLLPESTGSSVNPTSGEFITVRRKTRETPSAVNTAIVATSAKKKPGLP